MTTEAAGLTVERREELRARLDRESRLINGRLELPALSYRDGYALLDALAAAEAERDAFADEVLRWQQIAGRDAEELDAARVAVERVRALADEWDPPGTPGHHAWADELRAALDTATSEGA